VVSRSVVVSGSELERGLGLRPLLHAIEIEIEPQQNHPKQLGWSNHCGIVVVTSQKLSARRMPTVVCLFGCVAFGKFNCVANSNHLLFWNGVEVPTAKLQFLPDDGDELAFVCLRVVA
jgi:hypothetical protein